MPTLTVRDIPELVYERLRSRAARNRRSMSGEIVTLLEGALLPKPVDTEALIAKAETADAWFDAPLPDLIAEGKRAGRKYENDRPGSDAQDQGTGASTEANSNEVGA